ncbi:MAG: hypothetical protein J1E96_02450 [Ruminococcus sp.]|nr:hypothetical protein [Ruminococcus sp.]
MKKCDYCAKEISYFEQYCCDECQKNAIGFYDMQEKFTKIFSVINGICVFAIPVGLFVFSFTAKLGFTMIALATLILGVTIMLLPFPVENMISTMKIKKAVKVTRIIGLALAIIGIVLLIADIILFFI